MKNARTSIHGSSFTPKLPHHSLLLDAIDDLLRLHRRRPASALLSPARRLAAAASSLPANTLLANRLIALLARAGAVADARCLFDELPVKDICSYNTLVAAYVGSGDLENARMVFDEMPQRDHYSWSSIMSAYVRCGRPLDAVALYRKMLDRWDGTAVSGSMSILSSALAAAAAIPCLWSGREIHCQVVRASSSADMVLQSALFDMYAKCGSLDVARRVFDRMTTRDVVSWTAMVDRYSDSGRVEEGLRLFVDMLSAGVRPNGFTLAAVLRACAAIGAEDIGMQVHGCIVKCDCKPTSFAESSLVRMYAKFGHIKEAKDVFDQALSEPDVVSWSSMISGFAQNGMAEEALRYFDMFLKRGIKPDHVMLLGVLQACAHSGFVDEGLRVFHSMKQEHGIDHTADHYAVIVDLLARSGRIEEAEVMATGMPVKATKFLWSSLLGGSHVHKNADSARRAAESLFRIEPENATTYATLANVYASVGSFGDVRDVRRVMDSRGVKKNPGASCL